MLTPQKIQDLADPIESIYISMTNELLVNIGRHITSPNWTHTAAWEIQKLSELGQLTQENAQIINNWIKQLPQEIRDTMEETRRLALEEIEKELSKAAEDGYITPPMRDSTYDVLNEYAQQAADKMNLVNTTMLKSSVEQYRRMVQLTVSEEQAAATQKILNEETGAVVTGAETRTQALQRAIQRISAEGLTGFYDKAGRSWSPEAYVNMDIRTTVHNVAVQSVQNRMNDYGTSVFQVSAHAGARPLCYPYQGKLYSWNNTAGEIELGNGKTMKYEPLNSTSYGEPAGLFGINCGHSPIPMIPGVSIPHAQDYVQPKKENDKQYAESQQQRALERKIRAAKRAIEMGDDSPEAKDKLKNAQKDMREFIDKTGRKRRYDRENLYGGKKAPTPPADQRPTPEERNNNRQNMQPAQVNKVQPPPFTPAKTREEAEQFASKFAKDVSYDGISLENCNRVNNTLNQLTTKYPINPLERIGNKANSGAAMSASAKRLLMNGRNLGKKLDEEEKIFLAEREKTERLISQIKSRYPNGRIPWDMQRKIDVLNQRLRYSRFGVQSSYKTHVECVVIHEYGHILSDQYFGMINGARANPNYDTNWQLREMSRKWDEAFMLAKSNGDIYGISEYANTNAREFFAECFLMHEMGEKLPDYVSSLLDEVLQNGIM